MAARPEAASARPEEIPADRGRGKDHAPAEKPDEGGRQHDQQPELQAGVPPIVEVMTGRKCLKYRYLRRDVSFFFVDTCNPLWGIAGGREMLAAVSSLATDARGCGISFTAGDLPHCTSTVHSVASA